MNLDHPVPLRGRPCGRRSVARPSEPQPLARLAGARDDAPREAVRTRLVGGAPHDDRLPVPHGRLSYPRTATARTGRPGRLTRLGSAPLGAKAQTGAALWAASVPRHLPLVTWGVGWVALSVLPRFVFPSAEWLHEQHLYLATVPISLGLGWLAMRLVAREDSVRIPSAVSA